MKNMRLVFVKRLIVMTLGLILMGIGVALSKLASLGTSPIASIPNVLSFLTPLSIGRASLSFLILLVVLEAVILRQNFNWKNVVQLIPAVVFSFAIDFFVHALSFLTAKHYLGQLILTLVSVFILALGIFFELHANLLVMPGEGIAIAIAFAKEYPFSNVKVVVDISMVFIALVLILLGSHRLVGVREGTIIAAILTGHFVSFLEEQLWLTKRVERFVEN